MVVTLVMMMIAATEQLGERHAPKENKLREGTVSDVWQKFVTSLHPRGSPSDHVALAAITNDGMSVHRRLTHCPQFVCIADKSRAEHNGAP